MNSIGSDSDCTDRPALPTTSRRIAALSLVALVAGIGVATWLEGRGAVSYAGRLESRQTSISAARTAWITAMTAVAGQHVIPGEKLFELEDDRLTDQIAAKGRELVELKSELQRVNASADVELEWRRRELQSEIFQTQLKATSVTQERLNMQVEQLAWQDHLTSRNANLVAGPPLAVANSTLRSISLDSNIMSERRVQAMLREDAAAAAVESLAAQLALCEQRLDSLKRLDADLPTRIRLSAGVELAETRLVRVREELNSLEQQRESLTIVSPSHGTVGAVHRQLHDLVEPGESIVDIFDDDRRHVIASIPSSAVARLRLGTKLTVIFPAKSKRIGLVAAIPPQAMHGTSTDQSEDSQVAVRIEPAGKLWPRVPVGSRVKVQVPQ